jgi:aminoglycoside 3-N-acetyltransferase
LRKNLLSAIKESYEQVGMKSGQVIYITGNFGRPGNFLIPHKELLLKAHFDSILAILGPKGTLIVPTHSFSLVKTNIVFDIANTRSEMGPFTEFVRIQDSAIRQFHPFSSHTAYGFDAPFFCTKNSRHVFGPHSPFQRMIEADALYISVGQAMEQSISLVHHAEFSMGVPYRYTKEFMHPCLVNGVISNELFYLHVTHHNCDIIRDKNKKIMEDFKSRYVFNRAKMGRSFTESISSKLLQFQLRFKAVC